MNDVYIQADSLDARVLEAKQSKDEIEILLEEFRPFLNSRISRYSSQTDHDQQQELFSAAMIALYEAIQKYDAAKGHFFPFANQVVSRRLIDHVRQLYRHKGQTIPLEEDNEEQSSAQSAAINEISMRSYDMRNRQEMIAEEIKQFKIELLAWGITLDVLSKQSPRQKKLLETYRMIVKKSFQNQDIVQTIQIKHYFPIKLIAESTGLPQKTVERARTFTLASLIIKLGDYQYLSEYISDGLQDTCYV